jgi:hypothetical protein
MTELSPQQTRLAALARAVRAAVVLRLRRRVHGDGRKVSGGQAAFTFFAVILFCILLPEAKRVGLARVENVALGGAVSLAVGQRCARLLKPFAQQSPAAILCQCVANRWVSNERLNRITSRAARFSHLAEYCRVSTGFAQPATTQKIDSEHQAKASRA